MLPVFLSRRASSAGLFHLSILFSLLAGWRSTEVGGREEAKPGGGWTALDGGRENEGEEVVAVARRDVEWGSLSRTGEERESYQARPERSNGSWSRYCMALPDELSAANIAILVSKSAAEAARMKLAYGALFRIFYFCTRSL